MKLLLPALIQASKKIASKVGEGKPLEGVISSKSKAEIVVQTRIGPLILPLSGEGFKEGDRVQLYKTPEGRLVLETLPPLPEQGKLGKELDRFQSAQSTRVLVNFMPNESSAGTTKNSKEATLNAVYSKLVDLKGEQKSLIGVVIKSLTPEVPSSQAIPPTKASTPHPGFPQEYLAKPDSPAVFKYLVEVRGQTFQMVSPHKLNPGEIFNFIPDKSSGEFKIQMIPAEKFASPELLDLMRTEKIPLAPEFQLAYEKLKPLAEEPYFKQAVIDFGRLIRDTGMLQFSGPEQALQSSAPPGTELPDSLPAPIRSLMKYLFHWEPSTEAKPPAKDPEAKNPEAKNPEVKPSPEKAIPVATASTQTTQIAGPAVSGFSDPEGLRLVSAQEPREYQSLAPSEARSDKSPQGEAPPGIKEIPGRTEDLPPSLKNLPASEGQPPLRGLPGQSPPELENLPPARFDSGGNVLKSETNLIPLESNFTTGTHLPQPTAPLNQAFVAPETEPKEAIPRPVLSELNKTKTTSGGPVVLGVQPQREGIASAELSYQDRLPEKILWETQLTVTGQENPEAIPALPELEEIFQRGNPLISEAEKGVPGQPPPAPLPTNMEEAPKPSFVTSLDKLLQLFVDFEKDPVFPKTQAALWGLSVRHPDLIAKFLDSFVPHHLPDKEEPEKQAAQTLLLSGKEKILHWIQHAPSGEPAWRPFSLTDFYSELHRKDTGEGNPELKLHKFAMETVLNDMQRTPALENTDQPINGYIRWGGEWKRIQFNLKREQEGGKENSSRPLNLDIEIETQNMKRVQVKAQIRKEGAELELKLEQGNIQSLLPEEISILEKNLAHLDFKVLKAQSGPLKSAAAGGKLPPYRRFRPPAQGNDSIDVEA